MTIPSQNLTDISEFQYALLLLPSNFMSMLTVSSVSTKIGCGLLVLDTSSTNQIVKQIILLLYNNQTVKQIRGAGQGPCASAIISILKNCIVHNNIRNVENVE